jgi:hypothetical protein
MSSRSDREFWLHHKVKPPLHVCVEYNTAAYLKGGFDSKKKKAINGSQAKG